MQLAVGMGTHGGLRLLDSYFNLFLTTKGSEIYIGPDDALRRTLMKN
jgi:hypothetical protein